MIQLYFDKGRAFVWNADDWFELRSKYRICGALVGSLPSFPRQNDFLGLPLSLMNVETALLLEKGICELVELSKINDNTEDEKLKQKALEERLLLEQTNALREKKINQLSQKIDIILAGKRQKLKSKGIMNVQLDKQTLLDEEIKKINPPSPAHVLVHLPTEHLSDSDKKTVCIANLNPSVIDIQGAVRYSVYKDLWEKGYYISDGSKFGSDFLVYPGDPVRFHATYMICCIDDYSTMLNSTNLVAFGRLAVSVNKLGAFALCNNYGQIEYQTLNWHDNKI